MAHDVRSPKDETSSAPRWDGETLPPEIDGLYRRLAIEWRPLHRSPAPRAARTEEPAGRFPAVFGPLHALLEIVILMPVLLVMAGIAAALMLAIFAMVVVAPIAMIVSLLQGQMHRAFLFAIPVCLVAGLALLDRLSEGREKRWRRRTIRAYLRQLEGFDDVRAIPTLLEFKERLGNRDAHEAALIRLLSRLKASDAALFSRDQQRNLWAELTPGCPEYRFALLRAMERIGDADALPALDQLLRQRAHSAIDREVQETARGVQRELQRRLGPGANRLLRAAPENPEAAEHRLVMPAASTPELPADQLVRPSADS